VKPVDDLIGTPKDNLRGRRGPENIDAVKTLYRIDRFCAMMIA
jgi:hypothetical protein